MLYGVVMNCIDPILTIAATVSAKSPFVSPFDNREQADEAKQRFLEGGIGGEGGCDSDLLCMLNAYLAWKLVAAEANGGGSGRHGGRGSGGANNYRPSRAEEQFCRDNFLSLNGLVMIEQM